MINKTWHPSNPKKSRMNNRKLKAACPQKVKTPCLFVDLKGMAIRFIVLMVEDPGQPNRLAEVLASGEGNLKWTVSISCGLESNCNIRDVVYPTNISLQNTGRAAPRIYLKEVDLSRAKGDCNGHQRTSGWLTVGISRNFLGWKEPLPQGSCTHRWSWRYKDSTFPTSIWDITQGHPTFTADTSIATASQPNFLLCPFCFPIPEHFSAYLLPANLSLSSSFPENEPPKVQISLFHLIARQLSWSPSSFCVSSCPGFLVKWE